MYQLRVLGGFALQAPSGTAAPSLPQRRAEAALAILAACGDLGCTRERLIALLWPESDEAHSRHSLRDVLTDVRRALGASAVRSEGDRLLLDPTVVEADVRVFTQALEAGCLEDAVRVYRGPLLDGFHVDGAPEFEHWLDGERARLARELLDALVGLAERAEAGGGWRSAAGWWARAVEQDPLNSHFVLRQVRALAAHGDRANAIKLADVHARRLKAELDLEPDRAVLAKIERIRRGELVTPPARPVTEKTGDQAGRRPAGIRERLHEGLEGAEHLADRVAELTVPGAPPSGASMRWPRRLAWTVLVSVVALAGIVAVRQWSARHEAVHYPRTAIAVLPFQNLSEDSAHAYFAGGLHDELLTQLTKVAALEVIGRTSVLGYQGTTKPLRQIGEELAVGSLVEGTVRIAGSRLRVTVRLVDAVTQAHLWAENYDRTLGDAFAVESDIAQRVVAAVGAALTEAEASAIANAPTQSAEAYRFYLQGLEYWRRPGEARENLEVAQQLYQRAVDLDPGFAAAHASLSLVHGDIYIDHYDPSPRRVAAQRLEAETAVRLAPDLPLAQLAMGVVDYSREDYGRALEEFKAALRGAPNDAQIWEWVGFANRRLGRWDSVLTAADRAIRLDPRNAGLLYGVKGYTLGFIRHYPEALAAFRQALALAPDFLAAHLEIGWTYVRWKGQWDTLRAALAPVPLEIAPDQHLGMLLDRRQPDSLLGALRVLRTWVSEVQAGFGTHATYAAWAHLLRGDSAAARTAFDSAVMELDSMERATPGDWRVHGARGLSLACLGKRADALREARWLEQSELYRRDKFGGTWAAEARAEILVRTGETGAALDEVERLLERPGLVTVHWLQSDPPMDPIRHDPRFQALLAKYANPEARGAGHSSRAQDP